MKVKVYKEEIKQIKFAKWQVAMVKLDPEVNQCDVKLSKDLLKVKVKVKQKINIKKDKNMNYFLRERANKSSK